MRQPFAIVTGASSGTQVGQSRKDDPADVVSGWKQKLQAAIANVTPPGVLAEQHRKMAEPGSANQGDE